MKNSEWALSAQLSDFYGLEALTFIVLKLMLPPLFSFCLSWPDKSLLIFLTFLCHSVFSMLPVSRTWMNFVFKLSVRAFPF